MSLKEGREEAFAFVLKRGLLGLYVFVHLASLVPYSTELFSARGMIGQASDSPLVNLFPNVLALWDAPVFVSCFVIFGASQGLSLALGIYPRLSAALAYYVWACLVGRNPLITNPSLPYIGLLLLVCAVVGSTRAKQSDKDLERVSTLMWIVMALSYSFSGITKLSSDSWMDGSAVHAVLQSPLARPSFLREHLLNLPPVYLSLASYGALFLEGSFAPLALWRRARPFLWLGLAVMHLSLLALVDFADLSIGMLVLHAFTFDPRWRYTFSTRPPRRTQGGPARAFALSPSGGQEPAEEKHARCRKVPG